jgi:putative protein-disulfide isomerase
VLDKKLGNNLKVDEKDRVVITYYTDPLCCWSWGFEPQWRKLRYQFEDLIEWKYVMSGMLPDWQSYNDPINSITRPLQMGPLWFEARHVSGQPVNDKIWIGDYPQSSYPACIAVKCAELQSELASEKYLRALREAVMLNAQNISKHSVLLEIAQTLSVDGVLDFEKFKSDLTQHKGSEAFKKDLQEIRFHKIGRFPSLVLRNVKTGRAVIIVGYRPYQVLIDALKAVAPAIEPTKDKIDKELYLKYWSSATERELSEISGYPEVNVL